MHKVSDADFINLITTQGPHKTARTLGCDVRSVYKRRVSLENRDGIKLRSPDPVRGTRHPVARPGVVAVGRDPQRRLPITRVPPDEPLTPGLRKRDLPEAIGFLANIQQETDDGDWDD